MSGDEPTIQPALPLADTPSDLLRAWKAEAFLEQPEIKTLQQQRNQQLWEQQQPSWTVPALSILAFLALVLSSPIKKRLVPLLFPAKHFSPEEQAWQAIHQAEKQFASNKWSAEHSFASIVETFRKHIDQTYGIRAPYQTTEEVLSTLHDHPAFSGEQKERVKTFLSQADRVKFARGEIGKKGWEKVFDAAKKVFSIDSK